MSSQSSHHPQEVLLAQFSLKPDSFLLPPHFFKEDLQMVTKLKSVCYPSASATANYKSVKCDMHYLRIHLYCVLLQPGSDCPEAEDIDNGMIRYSVSTRVYNSFVMYDCVAGYYLSGMSTRRCQGDRTWGGTRPECG